MRLYSYQDLLALLVVSALRTERDLSLQTMLPVPSEDFGSRAGMLRRDTQLIVVPLMTPMAECRDGTASAPGYANPPGVDVSHVARRGIDTRISEGC